MSTSKKMVNDMPVSDMPVRPPDAFSLYMKTLDRGEAFVYVS